MPFLNEENQTDETKEILEKYFWLKILRAGGMDVESAWKVMINYINLINNNPAYFTKAHPPAKLDLTYQQQVIATTTVMISTTMAMCFISDSQCT